MRGRGGDLKLSILGSCGSTFHDTMRAYFLRRFYAARHPKGSFSAHTLQELRIAFARASGCCTSCRPGRREGSCCATSRSCCGGSCCTSASVACGCSLGAACRRPSRGGAPCGPATRGCSGSCQSVLPLHTGLFPAGDPRPEAAGRSRAWGLAWPSRPCAGPSAQRTFHATMARGTVAQPGKQPQLLTCIAHVRSHVSTRGRRLSGISGRRRGSRSKRTHARARLHKHPAPLQSSLQSSLHLVCT